MQSIEEKALKTYQNNIQFLSNTYPKVFDKIQAFNHSIENNLLHTKYDLEFLNTYFDVKQLSSGHYLYGENSIEVSKVLANRINFKKDSFTFEGFPLYYGVEKYVDELNDKTYGLSGVYPIMSYYIDNITRNSQMKNIEKFIFIGVGLGLHLLEIDKKIDANEYFIIEDDLELFYLSLFCTPYFKLENKTLYFAIAEKDNEFINQVNIFLENSFYLNRYLKYSYFPAHSEHKIKLIQNVLSSQDFASFPYKTLLTKYLRPLEYINKQSKIVDFLHHFPNSSISSKPILVLGAGPSLSNNIKWLKEYAQNFTIMAVASTLKILYKHQIQPDIITHLDGFSDVLQIYNGFNAQEFVKDSIAILGSFTPKEVREIYNKQNTFFIEEETFYFKEMNSIVGPCIGSTSIMFAHLLNIQEIYTLGTDFSIDSKTGATHSSDHVTTRKVDTHTKETLQNTMSFRKNLFPIEGNFQKEVFTNALFQISLQTLHNKLPSLKLEHQKLYNLNNGAKITTAIPLTLQDIPAYPSLNKAQLHNEIMQTLQQKSKENLSKEDLKSMQKRLIFAQESYTKILKYKNIKAYNNTDNYLYELLGLVSDLLQPQSRESSNLIQVYYRFYKHTITIIIDFFNTKNLKNEKKHMKKLDKFLIQELLDITKIYEVKIENFLLQNIKV